MHTARLSKGRRSKSTAIRRSTPARRITGNSMPSRSTGGSNARLFKSKEDVEAWIERLHVKGAKAVRLKGEWNVNGS